MPGDRHLVADGNRRAHADAAPGGGAEQARVLPVPVFRDRTGHYRRYRSPVRYPNEEGSAVHPETLARDGANGLW
jgi:hypothetical protein